MHDTLEHLKSCRGRNCSLRRQPQLQLNGARTALSALPSAVNHVQRNNKRKHGKCRELYADLT